MSRRSFYYYFNDRESLVYWIFRNDLAEALRDLDVSQGCLVYDASGMPYYTHDEGTIESHHHYVFLNALFNAFSKHGDFYAKALHDNQPGSLSGYISALYRPLFTRVVKQAHAMECLSDASCQIMSDLYLSALISFIREHVSDLNGIHRKDYLEALDAMATSCFISKYLRRAS